MVVAGMFESGAEEVVIRPTYSGAFEESNPPECDLGGTPFPLELNGCGFVLTGDTSQETEGKVDAVAQITCPGSAQIVTTSSLGCTIKVPPQAPTHGGVTYTNQAEGKVRVDETLIGLKYTTNAMCALLGFPSQADTLDMLGAFLLEGYEYVSGPTNGDEFEVGKHVGIEVS